MNRMLRYFPELALAGAALMLTVSMAAGALMVAPRPPGPNIGPPPPPTYPAPESQLLLPSDFKAAARYIWRTEPGEPTILRVSDYGETRTKRERVFIVEFKTWKGERKAYAFYRGSETYEFDENGNKPIITSCGWGHLGGHCSTAEDKPSKFDWVDDEAGQNLARADGKWTWRTEPVFADKPALPTFQAYVRASVSPSPPTLESIGGQVRAQVYNEEAARRRRGVQKIN